MQARQGCSCDAGDRDQMKAWPPSPHRYKAPRAWWSMIFSENRFPLLRIML
jgi:hypothetical protein